MCVLSSIAVQDQIPWVQTQILKLIIGFMLYCIKWQQWRYGPHCVLWGLNDLFLLKTLKPVAGIVIYKNYMKVMIIIKNYSYEFDIFEFSSWISEFRNSILFYLSFWCSGFFLSFFKFSNHKFEMQHFNIQT